MNIDNLIKEAMLEKNSTKKEAYRAIKAEILLQQTAKNAKEINEVSIIRKLIKQREESASIYDANSRKDLADLEREQIKYLRELLPPEISEDKIQEAVMTSYPNGFTQKEMGKVIKEIKTIYPTADGKLISEVVKKHII
jgi:uncharacterized protein YqeY